MEALSPTGAVLVVASASDEAPARATAERIARACGLAVTAREALSREAARALGALLDAGGGELLFAPQRTDDALTVDLVALARGAPKGDALSALADEGATGAPWQRRSFAARAVADDSPPLTIAAARIANDPHALLAGEYGAASLVLPYPGADVSGDAVYIGSTARGARFAIIDALGHGEAAAGSAEGLLAFLRANPHGTALEVLAAAHTQRAASPRGAATTLVELDRDGRGSGVGLGNVEALAWSGATRPVPRPGTIGLALPRLVADPVSVPRGGALLLHSDGYRVRWPQWAFVAMATVPASILLGVIHATAERRRDDASVLVIRRTS